MEEIRNIQIGASETFGPLQSGFRYDLRSGYTALVGPNNAGKSAILQLVFRFLHGDSEFGAERMALILPDRHYIEPTTQTGVRTLANWNNDFVNQTRTAPVHYASGPGGPSRAELTRLLLHRNLVQQVTRVNELLPRVGLSRLDLAGPQEIRFENVVVHLQGSGLRGLLPTLAAVSDYGLDAILIDEPELSLEPRLQKVVRDLLIEAARTTRVVLVATHSHLLINRDDPKSTQMVVRRGAETVVETVTTPRQLFDVTFDLLGSSTEDLFFPRNYLIVEGASDQVIAERVIALVDQAAAPTIKVLSSQGIDEVRARAASVVRALVPLIVNDSPYAGRVVALIDAPREAESASVHSLEKELGDRLYVLDQPTIEAYIPAEVYERGGRSRDADLARMEEIRSDLVALRAFKKEVSDAIAAALVAEDLDAIPVIRDAVQRVLVV